MPTPTAPTVPATTLPPPHVPGLVTRQHPRHRTTKCGALHTTNALIECGLQAGHPDAHLARVDLLRHVFDAPIVWTAPPREWVRPDVWLSDAHRRTFAVEDKTCGRWPDAVCNDRHVFDVAGRKIRATCTRRPGHTGRHAHGDMGQVWAVWEKRSAEELAAAPAVKGWASVPADLRVRVPEAPSHQVAGVARVLVEDRTSGGRHCDFHAVLDEARRLVVLGIRVPEPL